MKEIDKDGDGSITKPELKKYLTKYLGGKKKWNYVDSTIHWSINQ